jgi:hypothetical protein
MRYDIAILLIGIVVFTIALVAPMRWVNEHPDSYRWKRARHGAAMAVIFICLAILYYLAARAHEPGPIQISDCSAARK